MATKQIKRRPAARGKKALRCPLLRISFIHSDIADVERSLQELHRAGFRVRADVVLTADQFTKKLSSKPCNLIVAEYPAAKTSKTQAVKLLQQNGRNTPLIFLTGTIQPETVAELISNGAADCVRMDNIGHLPVVIRRVLSEEKLRAQRDRAEEELRHSKAHYRALVGNLMYGICHCTMEGKLLDVNQALLTMLGFTTKGELQAANHTGEIICDPRKREQLLGASEQVNRSETLEADWLRKDGTLLKVRLSGREVIDENGGVRGYEIIAEDVTKQRELENQLRQQATRDSLTGLANYRCLVDAIDNEVKRSKRTGREFALLLFDLDNLKKINDRYGHLAGSQTLCRLADVLSMGSRDIDTAARFGGDEFALVLPETDSESANLVSQRICSHFANDGREPKASVSVGIANFPTDGESIETLLSAADVALYKMKTTAHDRDNLGGNSTNLALVDGMNANAEAKRPIGSGTERRRHFRLKIVDRVHLRGAIGTPDTFEDMGTTVDVTSEGMLLTTSRDSYWVGQPLQVTFPFGSAPTDTNTARQARVVRNIVMPDLRNAIAVQFEDQVGTVGSWVS